MKVVVSIVFFAISTLSDASLPCVSNNHCTVGSLCEDGRCSNPFEKGCLRTMDARKTNTSINTFKTRVCNSDEDATGGTTANCVKPEFPYKEVRIAPGNWESSIVVSTLFFLKQQRKERCLVPPRMRSHTLFVEFHLLLNRFFTDLFLGFLINVLMIQLRVLRRLGGFIKSYSLKFLVCL